MLSVEGRLRKEVASFEKAWREFLKQQTVLKGVEEERRRADDTLKEAKETYKALVTQAPPLLRRSDVAVLALAENKCKMAGEAAKESRKAADDARGAVNNMSEKLAAQVKDLREKHDRAREQYTAPTGRRRHPPRHRGLQLRGGKENHSRPFRLFSQVWAKA